MRESGLERPSAWARLTRRWRSRRVVVVDDSMRPGLRPGDRLRVDPGAYRRAMPQAGEVVVLADPERRVRWLVKRVRSVDPASGAVEVRADAPVGGRDSRGFGPVPVTTLAGRAYRLYYPLDRARDL